MDDRFKQRRLDVLRSKEQKMFEEYGWYAHLVHSEDGIHANYHTHGVAESFKHPDLQITLNIDPNLAHSLFLGAISNIKNGHVFQDGDRSPLIIQNFDVLFKTFEEGVAYHTAGPSWRTAYRRWMCGGISVTA